MNGWSLILVQCIHSREKKQMKLCCYWDDRDAKGAVTWVNANIINVAVTRAKYRLCIIGDYKIWKQNQVLKITKV